MKSFTNLYNYPIDDSYFIDYCVNTTLKYKKSSPPIDYARTHREEVAENSKQYFYNYYTKEHKILQISDGVTHKKREIMIPADITEQVVHHMVIQTLQDKGFFNCLYSDTYGSIPGRGPHYGRKIIRHYIRHCVRKNGGKDIKYYLKTDISKYFPSIPHDKLKAMLARRIHDKKFLQLMYDIIDVNGTDTGLPIGFYTSQWLANWYLNEFDHYIAEHLTIDGEREKVRYFRYMDDMVIFCSNKKKIWKIKDEVIRILHDQYGLNVKPNWVINKFDYTNKRGKVTGMPLDFMGFKFYRDRCTSRKSTLRNIRRRLKRYYQYSKDVRVHQSVLYTKSVLKYTNIQNYAIKYIYPYVNFKQARRNISTLTKLNNKKEKLKCQAGTKVNQQ